MHQIEHEMDSWLTCPSDLADTFPNGEFAELFRSEWIMAMARETKANKDFSPRTIDTARWAREQIKRQIGTSGITDMIHPGYDWPSDPPFLTY